MSELSRIAFIAARDGIPASRDWALSTARIYRQAVLDKDGKKGARYKGHYASRMPWKRMFVDSYLELKRYGMGNK